MPLEQMFEVDQYALIEGANLQAEVLKFYDQYEFHPVVARLQVYCSESLGAFYLDLLKDRLYTCSANSLARRSAQTALYHIKQGLVRLMAPFLSFTAEEIWAVLRADNKLPAETEGDSVFFNQYWQWPQPDAALTLQARWQRVRAIREKANKAIEALRSAGQIGSSLQAQLVITAVAEDVALLQSLGEQLKFIFITSDVQLRVADALDIDVFVAEGVKCPRCWHHVAALTSVSVGPDTAHVCPRCAANMAGSL